MLLIWPRAEKLEAIELAKSEGKNALELAVSEATASVEQRNRDERKVAADRLADGILRSVKIGAVIL
jgi:hypothetical protein